MSRELIGKAFGTIGGALKRRKVLEYEWLLCLGSDSVNHWGQNRF